jgi:hypothetical protein
MWTFIDSFSIELTNVAGFSLGKAWKLVGCCCTALFAAMQPYRASWQCYRISVCLRAKLPACGQFFSVIKWQMRSRRWNTAGLPAVIKEMSLFMLTKRDDPSQVYTIAEKAKTACSKAEEANAEVIKLKDVITTL